MPDFIPILKEADIKHRIVEVSKRISSDYQGHELILIGVLKGSFIFLGDLARQLTLEKIQIDFLRASSYGDRTSSCGMIRLTKDIDIDISGKHVLIVEDIVDSGLTLSFLIDHLKKQSPTTIKVCTLIDKKERRMTDVEVDYACHIIEKGFVVGYGLDYAEHYRNLPDIYDLKI